MSKPNIEVKTFKDNPFFGKWDGTNTKTFTNKDLSALDLQLQYQRINNQANTNITLDRNTVVSKDEMITLAQNYLNNQKEEKTMTELNRKKRTVTLIDNDSSLPANDAIVFEKAIVSDCDREGIIREILFEGEVVEALAKHNKKRQQIVDEGILKRVGNEVKLRKVSLNDLTWNVSS